MICLCGHGRWQHIQWLGNCKACPATKTQYKLASGRMLEEPACIKFKDALLQKLKRQEYNKRYWRRVRFRIQELNGGH